LPVERIRNRLERFTSRHEHRLFPTRNLGDVCVVLMLVQLRGKLDRIAPTEFGLQPRPPSQQGVAFNKEHAKVAQSRQLSLAERWIVQAVDPSGDGKCLKYGHPRTIGIFPRLIDSAEDVKWAIL